MKITICGSIELSDKIINVAEKLEHMDMDVTIPYSTKRIRDKELTLEEYRRQKKENGGDLKMRHEAKFDLIKDYYHIIKNSDAILVLNFEKNGIKNYIGGNALIELGFARALNKPIYLYNPIPKMQYTDEIQAVEPIIINGDLSKIK
jgi:hypothetical protein